MILSLISFNYNKIYIIFFFFKKKKKIGKISLVDLAGSEKINKANLTVD
jgi:hypothetical protein